MGVTTVYLPRGAVVRMKCFCLFFSKRALTWDGGSVTEGSVKKGVVFMCYVFIENVTSGRPTDQALTTVEKIVCYSQFPRGGCTPPWCSVGK